MIIRIKSVRIVLMCAFDIREKEMKKVIVRDEKYYGSKEWERDLSRELKRKMKWITKNKIYSTCYKSKFDDLFAEVDKSEGPTKSQ